MLSQEQAKSSSAVKELLGYRVRNDTVAACVESIMQSMADGDAAHWVAYLILHTYSTGPNGSAFSKASKAAY